MTPCVVAGVRAVHADRHAGDAAGGLRDRPRLHVRHPQAAAHDHVRGGEGADPDVPQLAGPVPLGRLRGPAHVRHWLRGDGTLVQHRRRGTESKTVGVSEPSLPRAAFPAAPFPPPPAPHDDPAPSPRPDTVLQPGAHAELGVPAAVPQPLPHLASAHALVHTRSALSASVRGQIHVSLCTRLRFAKFLFLFMTRFRQQLGYGEMYSCC